MESIEKQEITFHTWLLYCVGCILVLEVEVWLDEPFVLLSPTLFDLPNNAKPHSNMSFKYDGIPILFLIHYFAYVMSGNSRKSLRYYNYVYCCCVLKQYVLGRCSRIISTMLANQLSTHSTLLLFLSTRVVWFLVLDYSVHVSKSFQHPTHSKSTFSFLPKHIFDSHSNPTTLQPFHISTIPSIHPSIFQTKHRNHFSLSFSQQLPNRSGSWKRGNIATHGAPGVIDEVGADERAGHVVGQEEAEAEGLCDGDHGGVLRPVGQEEIQRARSTLHTFVGSHGPHPIAHQIPAHSHPHPHPHPERTGERGGWLAVHHQHPTNSDVAIVDTPNCLPIHSALPTSLGTHSSV